MDTVTVIGPRSLFRAGLVSLLSSIGFESINETDDIKHLGNRTHDKSSPDMLIVCLLRTAGDVISAVGQIKAWEPTARIVFVVPKLDLETLTGCFAQGACGYLLESISRDALRESLKLVNAGEKVFPSELAALFPMLTTKFGRLETGNGNAAPPESDLSRREIEILRCLTDGQSNKLIAKSLDIAEATVKIHVKRILRKAHVINRTQAALWGVATGFASAPASRKVGS